MRIPFLPLNDSRKRGSLQGAMMEMEGSKADMPNSSLT